MKIKLTPAIVDGKPASNYFVCSNGNLWSTKLGTPRKMNPCISGGKLYPKTVLMINGIRKNIEVHRVVAETLIPFPKPEGISHKEWKETPENIKKMLVGLYQVNHIDHVHDNHHPSNLEWVSPKQNSHAYQKHRKVKG